RHGWNPCAGSNPPVVALELHAELVVEDAQVTVAAAHDSIRPDGLHFLSHHADIGLVSAVVDEAVVAETIVEMAEKHDVVLERDIRAPAAATAASATATAATTTATHARSATAAHARAPTTTSAAPGVAGGPLRHGATAAAAAGEGITATAAGTAAATALRCGLLLAGAARACVLALASALGAGAITAALGADPITAAL